MDRTDQWQVPLRNPTNRQLVYHTATLLCCKWRFAWFAFWGWLSFAQSSCFFKYFNQPTRDGGSLLPRDGGILATWHSESSTVTNTVSYHNYQWDPVHKDRSRSHVSTNASEPRLPVSNLALGSKTCCMSSNHLSRVEMQLLVTISIGKQRHAKQRGFQGTTNQKKI